MNKFIRTLFSYLPIKFIRYHYYRIEQFTKSIARDYDFKDKKILDIGAESSPFKKYFPETSYASQDIAQNKEGTMTYVGDMNVGIPSIPSSSYDYILCTQVLEHLYNPNAAFKEFSRILKPGGKLFLTTHMVFDEHMEPYDYYRFTKYGLRKLGDEAGFTVDRITPIGGVFIVLSYILSYLPIKLLTKRNSTLYYIYLVVFFLPILLLNIISYYLDYLDREKTLAVNYECVYTKK